MFVCGSGCTVGYVPSRAVGASFGGAAAPVLNDGGISSALICHFHFNSYWVWDWERCFLCHGARRTAIA